MPKKERKARFRDTIEVAWIEGSREERYMAVFDDREHALRCADAAEIEMGVYRLEKVIRIASRIDVVEKRDVVRRTR